MTGHIRRRGKRSSTWELKFDAGRDPATGKRLIRYHSFKGTKRDAERKMTELLSSVDTGSYVEPSKLTVAEHVRARVEQWASAGAISPKTAERYRELVENQIVPQLGAKLVQKLKPLHIETWHTILKANGRKDGEGGVSARTIGHAHRILKKALKEALRFDMVARNVAAEQSAPKAEGEEIEILAPDQVRALLAGLRGHRLYLIAVLSLATGMRRGEIVALRWGDIDLERGKIRVERSLEQTNEGLRFKSPKTKAGRREVGIPASIVGEMRDHWRRQQEYRLALGIGKAGQDDLVLPRPDGSAWPPDSLSSDWPATIRSLKLPIVTLHALRHTHVSQLIASGVDVVTVSRRIGHSNPTVTLAVYAHLFGNTDEKAASAVEAAMSAILAE